MLLIIITFHHNHHHRYRDYILCTLILLGRQLIGKQGLNFRTWLCECDSYLSGGTHCDCVPLLYIPVCVAVCFVLCYILPNSLILSISFFFFFFLFLFFFLFFVYSFTLVLLLFYTCHCMSKSICFSIIIIGCYRCVNVCVLCESYGELCV